MNSKQDTRNRIGASLLVLLYLFCSTFGVLMHSHSPAEGEGARTTAAISRSGAQPSVTKSFRNAKSACAVCEWQANQAIEPIRNEITPDPATFACDYLIPLLSDKSSAPVRASSRAPPISL